MMLGNSSWLARGGMRENDSHTQILAIQSNCWSKIAPSSSHLRVPRPTSGVLHQKFQGQECRPPPRAVRTAGPQPTVNVLIPPLCQKVVAAFNRLHPSMTILELCSRGKVRFGQLKVGKDGACVNFGLLRRCSGCQYRHEVCSMSDSRQVAIVEVLEGAMSTMKATAAP